MFILSPYSVQVKATINDDTVKDLKNVSYSLLSLDVVHYTKDTTFTWEKLKSYYIYRQIDSSIDVAGAEEKCQKYYELS